MSLEDFKLTWASELTDLSLARITTLWKKSKAMNTRDEILTAISASRAAAAKDQARRGKVHAAEPISEPVVESEIKLAEPMVGPEIKLTEPEVKSEIKLTDPEVKSETCANMFISDQKNVDIKPSSEIKSDSTTEPLDPVESEVNRRWSEISGPLNIDLTSLIAAVKKLHQWIVLMDIAPSDRNARVTELYECVDRLMTLRHKYGESVNVLKFLGQK